MQSKVISRKKFSSPLAYSTLYFDMANVSRMRAQNEPKTAKLAEKRAEFCIFESNAPSLKTYFYEPYVDMPSCYHGFTMATRTEEIGEPKPAKSARKDTPTPFERTLPCCLTSPLVVYAKTFSSSSIRDRFSKSAFRPKDY